MPARKKPTNIILILDKSGSMDSVRDATISSLNEYLHTLRKDDNRYYFTLATFNTEVSYEVRDEDLEDVEDFSRRNYHPEGGTALYDAVCKTLKKFRDNEDRNICVIMTDGFENSSQQYDGKDMRKLIRKLEDGDNWTFVYMGANQDSYAEATKWGFHRQNISNYNATDFGTRTVMANFASSTGAFASSDMAATKSFYTAKQQKQNEQSI